MTKQRMLDEQLSNQSLIEENERLRTIIKSILPASDIGSYFICGASTATDKNGLPDRLQVCPAYGVDWAEIYIKQGT